MQKTLYSVRVNEFCLQREQKRCVKWVQNIEGRATNTKTVTGRDSLTQTFVP
jgi:hypothetical protein